MIGHRAAGIKKRAPKNLAAPRRRRPPATLPPGAGQPIIGPFFCAGHAANASSARMRMAAAAGARAPAAHPEIREGARLGAERTCFF